MSMLVNGPSVARAVDMRNKSVQFWSRVDCEDVTSDFSYNPASNALDHLPLRYWRRFHVNIPWTVPGSSSFSPHNPLKESRNFVVAEISIFGRVSLRYGAVTRYRNN